MLECSVKHKFLLSLLTSTFLFFLSAGFTLAADFHVTTNGTPNGTGTQQNPWDFQTAINKTQAEVPPGSTVWIGPGTYEAPIAGTDVDPAGDYYKMFYINLSGSDSDHYVTIRGIPGDRPIIDGGVWIKNPWVIFRDFEVLMSVEDRISENPGSNPSKPQDLLFGGGIRADVKNIKVINNIVHDITGNGLVSFQGPNNGTQEWYGNILFNNGWVGTSSTDRNHGHNIYSHNNLGGNKTFENNVLLDAADVNTQVYSGGDNNLYDYTFTKNIHTGGSFLIGGHFPADRIDVNNNYFYKSSISIGYSPSTASKDNGGAIFKDNYVHLGNIANFIAWDNLTVTGNEFLSSTALPMGLDSYGKSLIPYIWNNNNYYFNNAPTGYFKVKLDTGTTFTNYTTFGQWQALGLDTTGSSLSTTLPTTTKVIINPNKYEPGKAYIAIYNSSGASPVSVDLSPASLTIGQRYRLRNVENLLSTIEFEDFTYTGSSFSLDMNKWTSIPPTGLAEYDSSFLVSTYPYYGVFVIEPLGITNPTVPPGLGGDGNNDGIVNDLDYQIWLSHYDQSISGPTNGDFNNNGKVDGIDYVIWLNNYNLQ